MTLSRPATQSFNVRDEGTERERGLWILSLLPLLSSGSASNQSLKCMPPLDEGKKRDWSSMKDWCERRDGEKETERGGSPGRRMTFELPHLKTLVRSLSAAGFTSVHPSLDPSPSLYHPHSLSSLSPSLLTSFQWYINKDIAYCRFKIWCYFKASSTAWADSFLEEKNLNEKQMFCTLESNW